MSYNQLTRGSVAVHHAPWVPSRNSLARGPHCVRPKSGPYWHQLSTIPWAISFGQDACGIHRHQDAADDLDLEWHWLTCTGIILWSRNLKAMDNKEYLVQQTACHAKFEATQLTCVCHFFLSYLCACWRISRNEKFVSLGSKARPKLMKR